MYSSKQKSVPQLGHACTVYYKTWTIQICEVQSEYKTNNILVMPKVHSPLIIQQWSVWTPWNHRGMNKILQSTFLGKPVRGFERPCTGTHFNTWWILVPSEMISPLFGRSVKGTLWNMITPVVSLIAKEQMKSLFHGQKHEWMSRTRSVLK